ncbi:MAG TPA: DUF3344 domain-containing protein, partial [Polyangiaceae bacterium]|nr:DUF3344 domain-containing protein [Polyangiaceae bacterium]
MSTFGQGASAAPVLRYQVDQHGDFLLVGNTLGHDCDSGNATPVVGTVGACGSSISDSSPDVFWQADQPSAGSASASTAVTVGNARSTAMLTLPAGVQVTYARLYWAAMRGPGGADASVNIEAPGSTLQALTADVAHSNTLSATLTQYESSADITELVQTFGSGAYRVSGVDSIALSNLSDSRAFAAWSMVVLYEDPAEPLRQLTIFDGLDSSSAVDMTVSGFLVPLAGIDAKFGVVAYGGDGQTGGDGMTFNGTALVDGVSASNKFFNSSRTFLGVPVSVAGDLPQLTGGMRSMSAVDLDVVDVTSLLAPNDTEASIQVTAGGDNNILIGALLTSITTFKPNFNESIKSAVDLNGGVLVAGDVIRYTIDVVNTGNDPAISVVLSDEIPAGLTYVPGSIRVTTDAVPAKTDPAGDDVAEFDAGQNLVRVRLGAGADAVDGGTFEIGESATVVFDVTVDQGTTGLVANRATITASGESGAEATDFQTDDGSGGGATLVTVNPCDSDDDCAPGEHCFDPPGNSPNECVDCLVDTDCGGTKPICNNQNDCEACGSDSQCEAKDPLKPACQSAGVLDGSCGECSSTNDDLCTGNTPQCLESSATCGCSDTDGDSECGAADSGMVCSSAAGLCIAGCSTAPQRNDCPADQICSKQDGTVGECIDQPCNDNDDCSSPTPVCDEVSSPHQCVQCMVDGDCTAPLVCSASQVCVECTPSDLGNCSADDSGAACLVDGSCGCNDDSDCGAADSGRVCDPVTDRCIVGCRGSGGNGCQTDLVCTSPDATIGACVTCTTNAGCTAPEVCDTTVDPAVCVGCVDDGDCTSPQVCDGTAQVCVDCDSDDDCQAPTVCSSTQTCIGCDSDDDCAAGTVCDEPTETCVGCTMTSDCDGGQVCDTDTQTCVGCTMTADCDGGQVCDTDTQTCVGCTMTADCDGGQVCDTDTQTCVECTMTADCDGGQV